MVRSSDSERKAKTQEEAKRESKTSHVRLQIRWREPLTNASPARQGGEEARGRAGGLWASLQLSLNQVLTKSLTGVT